MQRTRTFLTTLALIALPCSALAQPPVTPQTPSEAVEAAVERSARQAHAPRLEAPVVTPSTTQTGQAIEPSKDAKQKAKPTGYASILLKLMLAVFLVCAAAFISLKYGLRRLVGAPEQGAPLRVLSKLPLEPKRSIIVTQVASRTLVLATSEAGVQLIAELDDADTLALTGDTSPRPFDLDHDSDPDAEPPVRLD